MLTLSKKKKNVSKISVSFLALVTVIFGHQFVNLLIVTLFFCQGNPVVLALDRSDVTYFRRLDTIPLVFQTFFGPNVSVVSDPWLQAF